MDIPRMKEREETLRLYEADRAAAAALGAAEEGENAEIEARFQPRFDELLNRHSAERQALRKKHHEEVRAIESEKAAALGIAELQALADAASEAWQNCPLNIQTTTEDDYNEIPLKCAKSGVVILDDDETVVDEGTGEVFLRAAVGLPPRPQEAEEGQEEAA
jgi:hypothetical protein